MESIAKRKKTDKVVISESNLDLESYIANYAGYGRINRLIFIGDHCTSLRQDAYKIAISELKKTFNVKKFIETRNKLSQERVLSNKPPLDTDRLWIETTQKQSHVKTEKLEAELKTYKNNLIKESIRMGHIDLGDHLYMCGELAAAYKCYSRTKDYCTTAKHIIDMCLNVIKVSIQMGQFQIIPSQVAKAESTPEIGSRVEILAMLSCASGLACLDSQKFKEAAQYFVNTQFELGSCFNDVLSQNDVAIYGGLCALASFSRQDLKVSVLDNPQFKQFLEIEPQMREIIHSFYHSKYKSCLTALEKWKGDLFLDIYLHNHIDSLFESIRRRAIVQYFEPYSAVSLDRMADNFGTNVEELVEELSLLILADQIHCKIDRLNRILYAREHQYRQSTFHKGFLVGTEVQRESEKALLRINMIKGGFIVKD